MESSAGVGLGLGLTGKLGWCLGGCMGGGYENNVFGKGGGGTVEKMR